MIYNLKNKKALESFRHEGKRLIDLKKIVELKIIKNIRTSTQNRALHLFFKFVSEALNDAGITHLTTIQAGDDWQIETTFSPVIVKETIWKPIQKAMFGTDSTTKLKTDEIDKILEVLNLHFTKMGIEVYFPTQFNAYLQFLSKEL